MQGKWAWIAVGCTVLFLCAMCSVATGYLLLSSVAMETATGEGAPGSIVATPRPSRPSHGATQEPSRPTPTPTSVTPPTSAPETSAEDIASTPPSAPSTDGDTLSSGQGAVHESVLPNGVLLQVNFSGGNQTGEPFLLFLTLKNPTPRNQKVYILAFRGVIADMLQPVLDMDREAWSYTTVDGLPLAQLNYPDGLVLYSNGGTLSFSFEGVTPEVGEYPGDIAICFAPEVTPDTCVVYPLTIVVEP